MSFMNLSNLIEQNVDQFTFLALYKQLLSTKRFKNEFISTIFFTFSLDIIENEKLKS